MLDSLPGKSIGKEERVYHRIDGIFDGLNATCIKAGEIQDL